MSGPRRVPKTGLANLEERLKKLAADKSHLQLLIQMMNRLSTVPGLDNTVDALLRAVGDVIGGVNLILYYRIDEKLHYADVVGARRRLDSLDDDLVRRAFETREPVEQEHPFSDTQMLTPEFSKAYTWAVPLLVGTQVIGVLKMESLHVAMRDLSRQLPTFFSYAALVLKNEIEGYAKLKGAYEQLSRSNADLQQEMDARFRQQQFLEALLENTETGIVACDAEGVLTLFNRKSRELHGLPQEPLPADQWAQHYDLYLPDGKTVMRKQDIPLFRVLQGERVANDEMMILPKGGPPKTLLASGQIMQDKDGRKIGAVVAMHDITERKKAEDALRQAKDELEVRVAERTAELQQANEQLQVQLAERLRAEEALRDAAVKYRIVADNTYDWEFWLSPADEFIYNSPSCRRITGHTADEFRADPGLLGRMVHQDDRSRFADHRHNAVHTTGSAELEYRIVRPDGAIRWIGHVCQPVFDDKGNFLGTRGSNRDITERKQAEATLRRVNRELRAISDCNQVLMRAVDEQSLLNDVCRIVCDEAGYRMAWVGYAENDDARTVRPVAWAGVEDGYLAEINITWADTERGRGPAGTAIRSGGSACVQDFTSDPQVAPWRENALQRGYRSSIALPLKGENAETFGALTIYSTELNAFTPEEVRLMEELAGDLAFGITALRTRAERKRAEEAHSADLWFFESMDRINRVMQGADDLEQMMSGVLDTMLSIFGCDRAFLAVPCDPTMPEFEISMERTTPRYPGAFARRVTVPMTPAVRNVFQELLSNPAPNEIHIGKGLDPEDGVWKTYEIKSQLAIALHPKVGKPWECGLHQCSHNRIWTPQEKKLFLEISRRLGDALTSLLTYRDLRESEEKYRTLIQKLQTAVVVHAADTRIVTCNPVAQTLLGLTEDQLLGKTAMDPAWHFFHEDGTQMPLEEYPVSRVLATRQPLRNLVLGVHRPGNEPDAWAMVNANPVFDLENEISEIIVTFIDITERRLAQEKLAHLASIVESSDDAIIGKALDETIVSWNRGAERIYGYTAGDIMGRPISILVPPGLNEELVALMEGVKRGEGVEHLETTRVRKDRQIIQVALTISPIKNARGQIVGASTIARDITERKQTEAQIRCLVDLQGAILNNAAYMVISSDSQGVITTFNPAAERALGYTAEECVGRLTPVAFHDSGEVAERARIYSAELGITIEPGFEVFVAKARRNLPNEGEWTYLRKDGRSFPVLLSVTALRDPQGNITGFLGMASDITEHKRLQMRERMRAGALEKLIRGDALHDILDSVVRGIEAEQKHMLGSILLLDGERRHLQNGAGPSLPKFYNDAIHGVEIGPGVGSCGTAAYTGKRVIVEDIQSHPYWTPYREIADRAGLASCWSEPIINRQGRVLGTFAIYHREPCAPTPEDIDLIQSLASLIGVIIEHRQTQDEIRRLNAGLERRVQQRTQELAESEQRFRNIYETAPVSIWQEDWTEVIRAVETLRAEGVTDFRTYFHEHPEFVTRALKDVKILDVNQWTLEVFAARDKPSMLGSLETIFATPDTLPGFVGELLALTQGQATYQTEMRLNTVGRNEIWVLLGMAFPREEGSGKVLVSLIDITGHKQAAEEIQKLNEALRDRATALEAANQELKSFSYSVSHDLRAPLRAIDGFSQALLEDYSAKLEEEGRHYLQRVRAAAQRMGQLTDDLLELSRVTRGELRMEPVNLSNLAQEVAGELARRDPGRTVVFAIAPGVAVTGDARFLRVALENLLGNAWKFTSRHPEATIEFGVTEQEGQPVYFLRDNGAGFDMKYAGKLFGAFQRLHTPDEFPGTGVGLATVQRIIHRHAGRIWAESKVGAGATFYFTLPPSPMQHTETKSNHRP